MRNSNGYPILWVTLTDEAKAAFLLLSLPSSLSHVVDNLQTKDNLTYSDAYQKLLDLNSTNSDIHPTKSQAFIAKGRPQGKQKKWEKHDVRVMGDPRTLPYT